MELQRVSTAGRKPAGKNLASTRRRFWQRIKRFRQSKLPTPSVIGPFDYPQCFPAEVNDSGIRASTIREDLDGQKADHERKLPAKQAPQPTGRSTMQRILTSILSCNADLPDLASLSCCSPDSTTSNEKSWHASIEACEEIEVTPNHKVMVCSKEKNVLSPAPHIQLGNFESFVSDLSWDSIMLELPPPMAYYAVSTLKMDEVYPRRCYFTGLKITKNEQYYAGCVVQGRRTLIVFCHASALPDGDADIATLLSKKYSLAGLSNQTVWQSYNTVCHWSGLPIHTERDVHHRWKYGKFRLYLAEIVVEFLTLDELQALPERYEAKVPPLVLASLDYWETIDPTTTQSTTS